MTIGVSDMYMMYMMNTVTVTIVDNTTSVRRITLCTQQSTPLLSSQLLLPINAVFQYIQ